MSDTQTPTPPSQQGRGPERFAVPVAPRESPSMGRAVGAALALLGLLVGVPLLLVLFSGPPPVPTSLPSRDDLTQPLGVETLLVVLRIVVWLAWLQFSVCVVVEVVSLVRGGGLPRPVPLSGRSQALARALVGTLLVGSSFLASTGAANALVDTPGGPGTSLSSSSSAVTTVAGDAARAVSGDAAAPGQSDGPGGGVAQQGRDGAGEVRVAHVPGVPSDMTDVIGHKVAIVEPPDGHYHDNLWDIAERHLGDGRRWKEIYDLNQHRQQPDGQQLVLGRLIQPGWVLIMPDDASGLVRVQAAPTGADESRPFEAQEPGTAVGAGGDLASPAGAAEVATSQLQDSAPALGGAVLAAVLAAALAAERRRRRSPEPTSAEIETEVALRVGADEDRVARLDRALRGLSATCRSERVPLPQVYAASVDDTVVELRVAPAAPVAPAPWSTLDGGRRWQLTRDADQSGRSGHDRFDGADGADLTGAGAGQRGHAPYPGLVCLGRDDAGADQFIDLESVGGIVSFSGSDTVAREVVSALAVQLATAPWVDAQVVHGYQLAAGLGSITGSPLREVDDLDALLDGWAASTPRRDAQDVLSGRLGRQPGTAPQYLVIGGLPEAQEGLVRLTTLSTAGSRGVGVLAATPVPGARWRLRVDDAGRLSVPLLDLEVEAVRLTGDDTETLARVFSQAREPAPLPTRDRVPVPASPRPGDDGGWRLAEVALGVLGPVTVRTTGSLDPARLALATELATFVALQPAPVHPSVVGASVWPRGVTPEVRDATIARVRDWLGTDDEGNHLLRQTAEGRLHLADSVAVDWHSFCTLAARARDSRPHEERDLLRRALHLVRGELLEAHPVGRYSWLPRTRLEGQVRDVVVDAAHRLAALSIDDDPSEAAAACRAGLRLAPTSQLLWRDLLAAESDPSGPGPATVVDEMVRVLQAAQAPLEAETEALVVELMPDQAGRRDLPA